MTSNALVQRIRDQLAVVQSQWVNVPTTLRHALDQVGERLRNALDLPTKDELAKLSARLDELDGKLAALQAEPGTPADAPPKAPADKRARKK